MAPIKKRNFIKRNNFQRVYSNKACNKFLSTAKRMGNAGNYGRGTHIEEEHFQYFLTIVEELQSPAVSFEERVSMAANVLEETKGQEVHLASNQLVSKAIEALVGFAGEDQFERFIDVLGDNFRPICADPFASHVIQKIIEIAFLRAMAEHKIEDGDKPEEELRKKSIHFHNTDQRYNMETKFSKNHQEKCAAFVERISKFLLNNLEDFVSHTFGTFVIQSCVYTLAGIHFPKVILSLEKRFGRNKMEISQKRTLFKTPETWHEILKEFPSRLQMWPQFPDLVYNDSSSALLSSMCQALGHVQKNALKHFGKKIIKNAFFNADAAKRAMPGKEKEIIEKDNTKNENDSDDDQNDKKGVNDSNEVKEKGDKISVEEFPPVFWNYASMRLLESLINTAGPKLYNEIYKSFFEGRFSKLALNRLGFFTIKEMLKQMKDKTIFEPIFEELVENFDGFLHQSKLAIFPEISKACLRLNAKQAAFITALQSSLHCTTSHGPDRPKSFLSCLLLLKPFEELEETRREVSSGYGSQVAQDILQFKKPILLVNCFLDSNPKDLVNIVTSPTGSYVAQTFLTSKFIGEKSRDKFIKVLDGFYMDLALSQCGSRVLENIFHVGNETQKVRIAKELTHRDNKLKGTLFGRILFNKFRLETFKLSVEQWMASWKVKDLKGDELKEIVKKKKIKRTASTSEEKCELKKKK